ncbi:MAG: HAMP domain-containing histidine kinase [Flavobacteriales bacterium]|nr:HAMP domain-containing histidine kinase [Flavobacteriales bacterium]
MKIRTKLSLTFSIISSSLFIVFGVTIYLFSSYHRENEFSERILDRLKVPENFFLEKDSFSAVEFEKIKSQFLHTLSQETEEIIEIKEGEIPVFKHEYSYEHRTQFLENKSFSFRESDKQGASGIFEIHKKKYLIIVIAVDDVGLQNLSFLKYTILLLMIIGIPLVFIGSFVITKRALIPISRKIQRADTISASNLHKRLKVHNPNDEIGELAIAFNRLLDRLESSFDSQKSFISNASHEIRNPLTAILGEAEVALSKARSSEEYIESLRTVLVEAERLNSTVNNLLQLSKVTANEESLQYESVRLDTFVFQVIETYSFSNPNNQIRFNIDLSFNHEDSVIYGNVGLLKTVFVNLFDNACKFSSNDVVNIILSDDNSQLKLTVEDKGIGIAINDLDKVKGPFYRGNNTLGIKGSGIGLTLASKIIELHKGSLEIQSELNVGTKVLITLPQLYSSHIGEF